MLAVTKFVDAPGAPGALPLDRRARRFGASLVPDGVSFSLWAPGAATVDLILEHGAPLPLEAGSEGWFELTVPGLRAGSRYAFRLPTGERFADPASRYQPQGWREMSEVIDPTGYAWKVEGWRGRPWHEAVIYEVHIGTFTTEGTFAAAVSRLDDLVSLGITAIELMPLGEFPGRRGWGYDVVLPFAPESVYGRPEDLKALIDAAHQRGLMVFLDVVFNHFGPEGNLISLYAPGFFDQRKRTPWGAAINFEAPTGGPVREFFAQAALHWIDEYRFDGLRLDAVHAILDASDPHVLADIAGAVRAGPGKEREVHLVLENDANQSSYLRSTASEHDARRYDAQWNDDLHHVLHVLLTGESEAYYEEYADAPIDHLGRCLTEGFAFQGEWSSHRNSPRGESTQGLPASAFVTFLQNHDQVGNRALGERLGNLISERALRAGVALAFLSPGIPLLFMGEEWNASTPFLYFCDFEPGLAAKVRAGRRAEMSRFAAFTDPLARESIPDPNAFATFAASKLRWEERSLPNHQNTLEFYRYLLSLRRAQLLPHFAAGVVHAHCHPLTSKALAVSYRFADGAELLLRANFDDNAVSVAKPSAPCVYRTASAEAAELMLPAWSAEAYLAQPGQKCS